MRSRFDGTCAVCTKPYYKYCHIMWTHRGYSHAECVAGDYVKSRVLSRQKGIRRVLEASRRGVPEIHAPGRRERSNTCDE